MVNPVSKKRFKARVEGKGRVSVGTGRSLMKLFVCIVLVAVTAPAAKIKNPFRSRHAARRYVMESKARSAEAAPGTAGSSGCPAAAGRCRARSPRCSGGRHPHDPGRGNASAVAKGSTKTQRSSSTKNTVVALAGATKAAGPWRTWPAFRATPN